MELLLCRVVESFCLPTHNIVPHISWHDLPCHGTTKRYTDFPSMVIFRLFLRKFWIQTWFCYCQQYLAYSTLSLSASQVFMIEDDVGSPKSTSLLSSFHIGSIFWFFPANLMSSTYTDKNNPFFTVYEKAFPIGNLSPNVFQQGFLKIAFPMIVLPKDDHTAFVQEERLGLPYWTMILAICVVVDESKCLDIPIWESSVIWGTSSIFTWV